MSAPYYNEGVGQGGFIGNFSVTGNVIVESFSPDEPTSHLINQPDQFGGPLQAAAVAGFDGASMLVQLPFDGSKVTKIQRGETVTVPDSHGGGTYFVHTVGSTFQIGDYFKANLSLQKVYN